MIAAASPSQQKGQMSVSNQRRVSRRFYSWAHQVDGRVRVKFSARAGGRPAGLPRLWCRRADPCGLPVCGCGMAVRAGLRGGWMVAGCP